MESLFKILEMQKELGKMVGIDTDEKASDAKLKSAIKLIYDSSRERIYQVADNMARGIIRPDENISFLEDAKEPSLPEEETWDFHLGDTVTIKLSREDFKWMQKSTIGWRPNLNEVYGQVGVVTNVYCEFENSIGVYFPDVYTACSLYAGTLKKVKPRNDINLLSRWKVGDYVKTISAKKVLQLLQRGLDQIPNELIGARGRVVAVTFPCVVVTFDEKRTQTLKSSSLVRCHDCSSITEPKIEHARGFKVGEQVKLISNMKKLIENQKKYGGWNEDMSSIKGKLATIINMQKDGSLNLQTRHFRSWRISPDSVLQHGEEDMEEEDLKFLPGDTVKVTVPRNIKAILVMADVPSAFLEFLRAAATLTLIDDDIDYYVRFNIDQNIQTHQDILRKATTSEKEKHDYIKKCVEGLKVGDKVHLDVGPPNYVQSVLNELEFDPLVSMALTRSSRLIGFVNPYTAVIEYENEKRFRVKKKYLTVPDKFHVDESKDIIGLETIERIRDAISRSVQDIHSRQGKPTEDWSVNAVFMSHGNPPCVEYKVESIVATCKDIFAWLDQNSGWNVEFLCDGQFLVRGAETSNSEVKVGIIFNDEISTFSSDHDRSTHDVVTDTYREGAPAKGKAVPIVEGGEGDRRQPQAEEVPEIHSVDEFRYIKLFNRELAKNVYFPYIVRGQRRTPVHPVDDEEGAPRRRENVTVNSIQNVEYFHNA